MTVLLSSLAAGALGGLIANGLLIWCLLRLAARRRSNTGSLNDLVAVSFDTPAASSLLARKLRVLDTINRRRSDRRREGWR
jgi:hypothetical protein